MEKSPNDRTIAWANCDLGCYAQTQWINYLTKLHLQSIHYSPGGDNINKHNMVIFEMNGKSTIKFN